MTQQFPETFEKFLEEIKQKQPVTLIERNFINAIETAQKNPKALYHFFNNYNYFNAQIASTISALVANIGQSRDTFIDPNCPVKAEADFSFEVAEHVKQASIDEYADPQYRDTQTDEGVSHRTLATGVLKSIGDYAELSTSERNAIQVSPWLVSLCDEIQTAYSGKKDDLPALSEAMGVHIMSEWSADNIEFSNAAKVLFVDNANRGYHQHVQERQYIKVRDKTFLAVSWMKTHGGYNPETNSVEHGVEFEHLETGYKALKLAVDTLEGKARETVITGAFNGLTKCRVLLDKFFVESKRELEESYPWLSNLGCDRG